MKDAEECLQYWGGTNCLDGYRKEFFAQSFVFDDGSCLAIPPGFEDVYYFPAVKTGNTTTCLAELPTEYRHSPQGRLHQLKGVVESSENVAMLVPFTKVVRADGILHLVGLLFVIVAVHSSRYFASRM